ncbi:dispersed gene family protein 1 (DGF-1), partial [Trypanosoma cruzi]
NAAPDGCGRVVTHGATQFSAREKAGNSPDVSGQLWVTTFSSLDAFALLHFLLEANSGAELEGRIFRAFDVTTWAPCVWDEGVSGVFLDLRGAYNYWQGADDQAQLVFDSLVVWMCALEAERDLTDHFMNFGRILLQAFRMQLMMASDPGIRLSKLRARLHTDVHLTDTYARAAQLFVDR